MKLLVSVTFLNMAFSTDSEDSDGGALKDTFKSPFSTPGIYTSMRITVENIYLVFKMGWAAGTQCKQIHSGERCFQVSF